jgi:hypothetical protein
LVLKFIFIFWIFWWARAFRCRPGNDHFFKLAMTFRLT